VCRDQRLRVESVDTVWTCDFTEGDEITIVLKNGEGGFVADPETIARLEGENQVVFRYLDDNPNGSLNDIAGIINAKGNVLGMMPHPERVFRTVSNSWHPENWGEDGPWMRIFRNARKQLG